MGAVYLLRRWRIAKSCVCTRCFQFDICRVGFIWGYVDGLVQQRRNSGASSNGEHYVFLALTHRNIHHRTRSRVYHTLTTVDDLVPQWANASADILNTTFSLFFFSASVLAVLHCSWLLIIFSSCTCSVFSPGGVLPMWWVIHMCRGFDPLFSLWQDRARSFGGIFSHPPTPKRSFGVLKLPILTEFDLLGPKFHFSLDLFGSNFQQPAAHPHHFSDRVPPPGYFPKHDEKIWQRKNKKCTTTSAWFQIIKPGNWNKYIQI